MVSNYAHLQHKTGTRALEVMAHNTSAVYRHRNTCKVYDQQQLRRCLHSSVQPAQQLWKQACTAVAPPNSSGTTR